MGDNRDICDKRECISFRRGLGWLEGRADIGWNNRIGWYEGFHQLLSVTSNKRYYRFWLICWNGSRCSVFHTNRLSYYELDMIEAIRPTGGFPEADYAAFNANNAGSTS